MGKKYHNGPRVKLEHSEQAAKPKAYSVKK